MKSSGRRRLSVYIRQLSCLLAICYLLTAVLFARVPLLAESQSGFVNITATVAGPPPATAATIDSPTNGQVFESNPITVSGTCADQDLIISIIDNGNFVGSTLCDDTDHFSLSIDLSLGSNTLVARELDSLNQYGPDSTPVTVTYQPISSVTNPSGHVLINPKTSTPVSQLAIVLSPESVGQTNCQANQPLSVPLKITGGTAPYAVHVKWGDGSDSLISQATTDSFVVAHTYNQGGYYNASFEATDNSGQDVTLQVVIVINGKPASTIQKIITTTKKVTRVSWQSMVAGSIVGLFLLTAGYSLGLKRRAQVK